MSESISRKYEVGSRLGNIQTVWRPTTTHPSYIETYTIPDIGYVSICFSVWIVTNTVYFSSEQAHQQPVV